MNVSRKGIFIISLDFELNWGVHDVFTKGEYDENLKGTREAIDEMLALFQQYRIHATWASVGMLSFDSKEKLLQNLPEERPTYKHLKFSPYEKIEGIGQNEIEDPHHYGASIIKKIKTYVGQEIATHTFSHYYCLEDGQTKNQFEADLKAAIAIQESFGDEVKSIAFPRNQLNEAYLVICQKHGIQSYRGNENSWIYKESKFNKRNILKRFFRLADSYMNLTGHHTYCLKYDREELLLNLPSSRFLRPFDGRLKKLERLRLRRIKRSIAHAVQNGEVYHLWWHPHNFGKNIKENIDFLQEILQFVDGLVKKNHLISLNMREAVQKVENRTF